MSLPLAALRPLPFPIRPIRGETPASVFIRLAHANELPSHTLWAAIRATDPSLPYTRRPEAATAQLEQLGGLQPGWFDRDKRAHIIARPCIHNDFQLQPCQHCAPQPTPRPGCTRCANGASVIIADLTGAICIRHRRWIAYGTDIDVRHLPRHIAAERHLRRTLAPRGITIDSPETELALQLLGAIALESATPPPSARTADHQVEGFGEVLFHLYPETIRLTAALTSPAVTEQLTSPRPHPVKVARVLLSAAEATAQWANTHSNSETLEASLLHALQRYDANPRPRASRALEINAYTVRSRVLHRLNDGSLS